MIIELISMNGYGIYVWGSFGFTLTGFLSLYLLIKYQLLKQQSKFLRSFGSLSEKEFNIAKEQKTNKIILDRIISSEI